MTSKGRIIERAVLLLLIFFSGVLFAFPYATITTMADIRQTLSDNNLALCIPENKLLSQFYEINNTTDLFIQIEQAGNITELYGENRRWNER